jgi:hypothetical protein
MSLDLSSIDACIQKLRYVSSDTEVLSSDLNDITDCLKALSSVLRVAIGGDPLVDELDAIIAKLRYVRSGDVVEPDDHNLKVDAIKKARDILAKMESYYVSQLNILASISPFAGLGVGFGFSTNTDSPVPPSLPYAGAGLLTVDVAYDYGYVSPSTALVVEAPVYKPGYYTSDGVS